MNYENIQELEGAKVRVTKKDRVKLFIEGLGPGKIGFSVSEELMKKVLGKKE